MRRRALLTVPPTEDDEAAFDRLVHAVDAAGGAEVEYDAAPPKHAFLRYLLEHRAVLLHGTGDADITIFEPRRQTDYDNRWTYGVFATDDAVWPIFFAVVNRPVALSLVNGCSRRDGRSGYYFSIGTDPRRPNAWRTGWIYVLPRPSFTQHPAGAEWLSPTAVRPLARLRVEPSDFPFLGDVAEHRLGEPVGRIVVRATLLRALRR